MPDPECGSGPGPYRIRANTVGVTMTGMPVGNRTMDGSKYETKNIHAGHIGVLHDAADVADFLVFEKSKFIIGTMLPVDSSSNIATLGNPAW